MIRHLFSIAAAISLVLAIATISLWGRSYWQHDAVTICRGNIMLGAESFFGCIVLEATTTTDTDPDGFGFSHTIQHLRLDEGERQDTPRYGVSYLEAGGPVMHEYDLRICDWVFVIILSVLPALRAYTGWRMAQRRRRTARQICVTCGYDLRASADHCPECGTPIRRKG